MCELWAENESALDLYCLFSTQWRVGMSGAVGLDYGPILHHLDRKGVSGDAYDDLMASIAVIERAAMEEFEKK